MIFNWVLINMHGRRKLMRQKINEFKDSRIVNFPSEVHKKPNSYLPKNKSILDKLKSDALSFERTFAQRVSQIRSKHDLLFLEAFSLKKKISLLERLKRDLPDSETPPLPPSIDDHLLSELKKITAAGPTRSSHPVAEPKESLVVSSHPVAEPKESLVVSSHPVAETEHSVVDGDDDVCSINSDELECLKRELNVL